MKNRLATETSPYLKQHEDNPVDWYPWGTEALTRAREENKPILLSVGYSACHWCHVMAHESFENPDTAKLMNENFINIKVDREERPDLDQIYQNVAQAMNQGGGWPLTVFLTPDLRPFFGGTYFPPEDKYGRPGFPRVLTALANAFHHEPANVEENAAKLTRIIAEISKSEEEAGSERKPTFEELGELSEKILSWVDGVHGGFGSAPKFPNPMMLTVLWRASRHEGYGPDLRERLGQAAIFSLRKMAEGGIFDQIGGGFSRYSVDERWAVPHFEKMLYDNALLVRLYSEVVLTNPELHPATRTLFLETISKTVTYLLREMQSSEGLFYAAQDADSEGEEGKFFVWKPEELAQILNEEELEVFQLRYGVDEVGNFEHGTTVLYQAMGIEAVAARAEKLETRDLGARVARVRSLLEGAEKKVFEHREKRIRPGLDSKCLVSWNGLMISGLVWASRALAEWELGSRAAQAALQAWEGVQRLAKDGDRLFSTVQAGKPKFLGYLDDYAFMSKAAIDLTLIAPERAPQFLLQAAAWLEIVLKFFKDETGSGYFFTASDHEKLIQRPKSSSDQAIPSGAAVLLQVFQVVSEFTEDMAQRSRFEKEYQTQLSKLTDQLMKHPYGQGELFCAQLLMLNGVTLWSGEKNTLERLPWNAFSYIKGVDGSFGPTKVQKCTRGTCELVSI